MYPGGPSVSRCMIVESGGPGISLEEDIGAWWPTTVTRGMVVDPGDPKLSLEEKVVEPDGPQLSLEVK